MSNDALVHLIDDDDAVRDSLAFVLDSAGFGARTYPSAEDFLALVARLRARSNEVPGSIARLAAAANAGNVATLSHDDMSPEQRRWFRDLVER